LLRGRGRLRGLVAQRGRRVERAGLLLLSALVGGLAGTFAVEHGALLGTESGPEPHRGAVSSVVRRGVRREAFMGGDTLRGCRGAVRRSPTAVSGPTGSCHEPWVSAASRSGDNGSPTVPSRGSSGPCARRCWI